MRKYTKAKKKYGGRRLVKKSRKNIGGASLDQRVDIARDLKWIDQLVTNRQEELKSIPLSEPLVKKDPEPTSILFGADEESKVSMMDILYGTDSDEEDEEDEEEEVKLKDDDRYKKYFAMIEQGVPRKDVEEEMTKDDRHYFDVLDEDPEEPIGDDPYENMTLKDDKADIERLRGIRDTMKKEGLKQQKEREERDKAHKAQQAAEEKMTPGEKRNNEINKMLTKYKNELINMAQYNKKKFNEILVTNKIREEGDDELDEFRRRGILGSSSRKKRRKRKSRSASKKKCKRRKSRSASKKKCKRRKSRSASKKKCKRRTRR